MSEKPSFPDDELPAGSDDQSPAEQAVLRKTKLAIAVMALTLLLSFGAIIAAIFVKLNSSDNLSGADDLLMLPAEGCTLDLPLEADIISTSLDGEELLLIVKDQGRRQALLFSLSLCRKLSTINLGSH